MVKVRIGDVVHAMLRVPETLACLFDAKTGKVQKYTWSALNDGEVEVTDHFRVIEPPSPRERWLTMEDFALQRQDTELRNELLSVIQGEGAFDRFMEYISMRPDDTADAWFAFQSTAVRTKALAWLEEVARDLDVDLEIVSDQPILWLLDPSGDGV